MIDRCPTQLVAVPDATSGVAALIALIEGSQILAPAAQPASWAPSGYEASDIRILEWIGSHRRPAADLAA
jgi:hypothetical protein